MLNNGLVIGTDSHEKTDSTKPANGTKILI